VSYQADVRIEVFEASGEAHAVERLTEFYAFGLRRRQVTLQGKDVVVIDRPDLHVSWLLDPKSKSFEQVPLRHREAIHPALLDPFGPRARVRFRRDGWDESGTGRLARFTAEGPGLAGFAWLSEDGVPQRFEGEIGEGKEAFRVRIEYEEVRRVSQPAYLFAIPPNYAGYEARKRANTDPRDQELLDTLDRLRDTRKTRPASPWGM